MLNLIQRLTMSTSTGGHQSGRGAAATGATRTDASAGDKRKASDVESGNRNVATDPAVKKSKKRAWTTEEDDSLLAAVLEARKEREEAQQDEDLVHADSDHDDDDDWDEIAEAVPGRTAVQCLQRFMKHLDKTQNASKIVSPGTNEDGKNEAAAAASAVAHTGGSTFEGSVKKEATWSLEDAAKLQQLVEEHGCDGSSAMPDWSTIAGHFPGRTALNCLGKWKELTKTAAIKGKGSWTPEEDQILREKRALYGRKWAKIASHLPGRQGKQCRERYVNHLDPALKKGEWTEGEEAILIASHQRNGNKWAAIAKEIPGRSDNDVKNHWYSTIQRKFQQHGKEKITEQAMNHWQVTTRDRPGTDAYSSPAAYGQSAHSYPHALPPYPPPYGAYGHLPPPPLPPHGYQRHQGASGYGHYVHYSYVPQGEAAAMSAQAASAASTRANAPRHGSGGPAGHQPYTIPNNFDDQRKRPASSQRKEDNESYQNK